MFRESYYSARTGVQMRHALMDDMSKEAHAKGYIGHIGHCFDYVRQGILCAGDMAVEKSMKPTLPGDILGIHQCRDWEMAIEWG